MMYVFLWANRSMWRCAPSLHVVVNRVMSSLISLAQTSSCKHIMTLTLSTLALFIVSAQHVYAERAQPARSRATGAKCGVDLYEPNNRRYKARNISNELNARREVNAQLCAQDRDWYTVWLNRGELVELHVTTSLELPPHIRVFAPRKRKPSGITRRVSPSHRRVRVYAKSSGHYRVLVSGSESAQTRYRLSMKRPTRYGL